MSVDFEDFNFDEFESIKSEQMHRQKYFDKQDWFLQDSKQQQQSHSQCKNQENQIPLFPVSLDDQVELDLQSGYARVNVHQKNQITEISVQNQYTRRQQEQIDQIFKKYQSQRLKKLKNKQLDQIKSFNLKNQKVGHEEKQNYRQVQEEVSFSQSQIHSLLNQSAQSVLQRRKVSTKLILLFLTLHFAQIVYLFLGKIIFYQPRIQLFDFQNSTTLSQTTFAKLLIFIWISFHIFLITDAIIYSFAQFLGKILQIAYVKKIFNEDSVIAVTKNSILLSFSVTLTRIIFLEYVGLGISLISIFIDSNMLKQFNRVSWQRNQFQKNYLKHSLNQVRQIEQNLNNETNQLMRI